MKPSLRQSPQPAGPECCQLGIRFFGPMTFCLRVVRRLFFCLSLNGGVLCLLGRQLTVQAWSCCILAAWWAAGQVVIFALMGCATKVHLRKPPPFVVKNYFCVCAISGPFGNQNVFLRSKRYGKNETLLCGVTCGELVHARKVPFLLRKAYESPLFRRGFRRKFVHERGFRAEYWQNLGVFMPRKGYDTGTKKKRRNEAWCGFPSSNVVRRNNNHLRWSPVLQHRRPPLQVYHKSGRSTGHFPLCTIQNVRKGVRKPPPPFRTPLRTLSYPRGYERVGKAKKGVTKGYPFVDSTESSPFVPLSWPYERVRKGGAFV